jgi:hypothetical protein
VCECGCGCGCECECECQCQLTSTGGTNEHHPRGVTASEPHGLLGGLDGGPDGGPGGFLELVDFFLQLGRLARVIRVRSAEGRRAVSWELGELGVGSCRLGAVGWELWAGSCGLGGVSLARKRGVSRAQSRVGVKRYGDKTRRRSTRFGPRLRSKLCRLALRDRLFLHHPSCMSASPLLFLVSCESASPLLSTFQPFALRTARCPSAPSLFLSPPHQSTLLHPFQPTLNLPTRTHLRDERLEVFELWAGA